MEKKDTKKNIYIYLNKLKNIQELGRHPKLKGLYKEISITGIVKAQRMGIRQLVLDNRIKQLIVGSNIRDRREKEDVSNKSTF